jgi:hypothetical protein
MLLDTVSGRVEWRRVSYPIRRTQARMRSVGLPERLIARLEHGL